MTMENILRIKEQCKKKEIKLVELAKELGITPVSLSQALKRKTISVARLEEIAQFLGVDVLDLLETKEKKRPLINGHIEIDGYIYRINSVLDMEKALSFARSLSDNINNDNRDY